MLSAEDNELITRIGPGTAMGDLYRRFWLPVLLAEELPAPDCAPVRLQVLGERLIAFKDSAGRVGVLDQRCPHRQANLFWGRNEEGGLRCAYHGWKYNVEGDCVDLPNAPEGSVFKEKIHAFAAYRAVERGGFVWTYMGPPDRTPEFPDFELNSVPESHRYISKIFIRGNYLQSMEGDIDSSHVSFLHSRVDSNAKGLLPEDRAQPAMFQDLAPRWSIKDTEYGMMLGAERTGPEGKRYWRINQWLMPSFTMIAARPGTPVHFSDARADGRRELDLLPRHLPPRAAAHRRGTPRRPLWRVQLPRDNPRDVPPRREQGQRLPGRPRAAAHGLLLGD